MTESRPHRPEAVRVIGWLWLGLGALMVLSGTMGYLAHSFVMPPGRKLPPTPEEFGPVISFVFKYFAEFAVLQVCFALFIVLSAVAFLRLRSWARWALQLVTWTALLYVVGFGILWLSTWFQLAGSPSAFGLPSVFRAFGMVMGIVVTASFAVPLVIMLRYLGSEAVRSSCNL
jgi:hypothetical protein